MERLPTCLVIKAGVQDFGIDIQVVARHFPEPYYQRRVLCNDQLPWWYRAWTGIEDPIPKLMDDITQS